ncbi:hypothetical protein GIB67_024665, partial [Kingdonia uniflora]
QCNIQESRWSSQCSQSECYRLSRLCSTIGGRPTSYPRNDVITLATPRKKWYICGVGKHCEVGDHKLVITVLPEVTSPAPSPQSLTPTSSTKGITSPEAHMFAAVALVTMTFIT